ncbi:MAG TPA: NCS1 family nucleobase:cation symporter-1 [Polyangia bacterium]|jgi:NCS1 family nucleobase:cation symporter-1|nr:NCS1 family nucleobase:cation symporter-1 [Polyangia bacterium]
MSMTPTTPGPKEPKEIVHADGRVELDPAVEAELEKSPLYNHDLAPVRVADRTWSTYNFAALWISMAHCIPTYFITAKLLEDGMSWAQALFTVALGNIIVLFPILANSHPGTKYGIPFPVYARAAYGTGGANLPAIMRALVACGWFGIQCWIGGEALDTFLRSLWPGWATALGGAVGGHRPGEWISFLAFWGLNILIVYRGMDLLRRVENWAAPFVLVMTAILLGWAIWRAQGLGPILAQKGRFGSAGEFLGVFVYHLTAMIGYWATLSLNMPDFTRYGRSQREQMVGQVVALPTTMTVFAGMGVFITSATAIIYGRQIWDPVELVGQFKEPWIVAIAMFTIVVATLSVNIAANVVSPANDFANAFPRHITFARGGLITGVVGILMCPWKLLEGSAIYGWLVGYSGGLAAIAGVLITDYFLVRKKALVLADLYRDRGVYYYRGGWNGVAVVATLVGCLVAWMGPIMSFIGTHVPALAPPPALGRFFNGLFDYAWFVGFGISAGIYRAGMKGKA